jgi:hypothetical protein
MAKRKLQTELSLQHKSEVLQLIQKVESQLEPFSEKNQFEFLSKFWSLKD